MSEYQYYEFLAIDHPLTNRQMAEVRRYSTRAEITPTRFVNTYEWGNFKGDPVEFLAKYYDCMVYVTNWGTHQFMFRVPEKAVDKGRLRPYLPGFPSKMTVKNGQVILDLESQVEPEDWEEGDEWMAPLTGAREALLRGDERVLYLAWLSAVNQLEVKDKVTEPPVPAGLENLETGLKTLADFLRIDRELLKVAAQGNAKRPLRAPAMAKWISKLPLKQKDRLLLDVMEGKEREAARQLRQLWTRAERHQAPETQAADRPRTAGELRAAAGLEE